MTAGSRTSNARKGLGVAIALFSALLINSATRAQAPRSAESAVIAALLPGEWQLRATNSASPTRILCLHDMRTLVQVAHTGASCAHSVIVDTPEMTTVYYTCHGQGNGQTTLRIETARLVQIDSQGVRAREPFALAYEARRIGECSSPTAAPHPR